MTEFHHVSIDALSAGLAILRQRPDASLELGYTKKIGPNEIPVYYPRLLIDISDGKLMISSLVHTPSPRPIYRGSGVGSHYNSTISSFYTRARQEDGVVRYTLVPKHKPR